MRRAKVDRTQPDDLTLRAAIEAILDAAFEAVRGAPKPKPADAVEPAVFPWTKAREVRRLFAEGFGVDDVRVKANVTYLHIWGILRTSHRIKWLRPYERIALVRASYEQGLRT